MNRVFGVHPSGCRSRPNTLKRGRQTEAFGSWSQCMRKRERRLPMNRPKDLGRTKIEEKSEKHLCPSQIFGFPPFRFRGSRRELGFGEFYPGTCPRSAAFMPLKRRSARGQ